MKIAFLWKLSCASSWCKILQRKNQSHQQQMNWAIGTRSRFDSTLPKHTTVPGCMLCLCVTIFLGSRKGATTKMFLARGGKEPSRSSLRESRKHEALPETRKQRKTKSTHPTTTYSEYKISPKCRFFVLVVVCDGRWLSDGSGVCREMTRANLGLFTLRGFTRS